MKDWSEHLKPNCISNYEHVFLHTPIGTYLIEWVEHWTNSPDYDVSLNNEWVDVEYSLEAAKLIVCKHITEKSNELINFLK
jgi:hypothetical protein